MPATPLATLPSGIAVYGLTTAQWQAMKMTLRRYYAWVDSGKRADPWASGVAHASRLGGAVVKRSRPAGYDAGHASPPDEVDTELVALDAIVGGLAQYQRYLLRWRIAERVTCEVCAERLGVSMDVVKDRWGRLGARLYAELRAGRATL